MSAKKGDRENKCLYKLGDRVIVKGKHAGIVRFVGKLALNEDLPRAPTYVGVQLHENVGSLHNGVFRGKRYFHCRPGHAAMVKIENVSPDPPKKSTPKGNAMFLSYQKIKARRQERSAMKKDRREIMEQTLEKLLVAYEEGRQLMQEERLQRLLQQLRLETETETESEAGSEQ